MTNLAFHPTGDFLLSSSLDASLRVWDLREGQLFYTLHGHEGATNGVTFSPAGDYFASAGVRMLRGGLCCVAEAGSAMGWAVQSGCCLQVYQLHTDV